MAFVSYSPFFASGLLAPSTPRSSSHSLDGHENDDDMSPPASPMSASFDDGMDLDTNTKATRRRDSTSANSIPRPRTTSTEAAAQSNGNQPAQPNTATTTRTLRRRRSSLTQNASPSAISSLRSPQRAAENALHLQRQLHHSRSRSGSIAGDRYPSMAAAASAVPADATTTTTPPASRLVGRARSGSLGCALRAPPPLPSVNNSTIPPVPALPAANVRTRRAAARRIFTGPAPITPPPNAPLPALPPSSPTVSKVRSKSASPTPAVSAGARLIGTSPPMPIPHSPPRTAIGLITNMLPKFSPPLTPGLAGYEAHKQATTPAPAAHPAIAATSARARGLSVSGSALNGDADRIDEMKEN